MPTLHTRAPDLENSASIAKLVLVAALIAIAFTAWQAYAHTDGTVTKQ